MAQLKPTEAARRILERLSLGEEVISVLATDGPAAGARVLVLTGDVLDGTFGSPATDARAAELARAVRSARAPRLESGLFAELHAPADTLIIFGAGHIAVPLAELGSRLGFAVTVLDDRDEFASADRFAEPVRVRALDLTTPLAGIRIDNQTYVVLVTRGHKLDFDLLRAILSQPAEPRYIGMIGSRRRVRAAFTALLDGGVAREQLERVRAPVGLDIGAETPVEIAVSIAAEIIQVRHGGTAASLATEERVLDRFFVEQQT